jgi:hypothetical protein
MPLITAYLVAGLVFAAAFLRTGVSRLDSHAEGSGVAFRLILLPGVLALWPLLLWRWVTGRRAE